MSTHVFIFFLYFIFYHIRSYFFYFVVRPPIALDIGPKWVKFGVGSLRNRVLDEM